MVPLSTSKRCVAGSVHVLSQQGVPHCQLTTLPWISKMDSDLIPARSNAVSTLEV